MSLASRRKVRPGQQPVVRKGSASYWLIGGAVFLVALIAFAIYMNSRDTTPAGPIAQPEVEPGWINGMSMGNPEATIVLQAFEDFVPALPEVVGGVETRIVDEYVKTGQIRFEYKTFPLQGFEPAATEAALAAYCAADQNAFWPYHDRLFSVQSSGQAAYTTNALINYAADMGLNESDFRRCLTNRQHQAAIAETQQAGIALGVRGTPAIFINGQMVESDYATIKAELDRLLAAGG